MAPPLAPEAPLPSEGVPVGAEGANSGALNQQVTLPLSHVMIILRQDDSEQGRPHLAAGP